MADQSLQEKLDELKRKQKFIEEAWKKAGNRELLAFFVELIPMALKVQRCSIFIMDPDSDQLWLQSGTGLKEKEVVVPAATSLVGRAISSGEVQIENDMANMAGIHDLIAVKTGFPVYNAMVVPVHGVTTDKVTGAIEILNKPHGKEYSDDDQEVLEKMAFNIQMNIENIYVRQEMAKISGEMGEKIRLLEERLAS